MDHIESVLRLHDTFTSRSDVAGGASELIRGRDPDNLPLTFVCYAGGEPLGVDYYRSISNLVYSLDV